MARISPPFQGGAGGGWIGKLPNNFGYFNRAQIANYYNVIN